MVTLNKDYTELETRVQDCIVVLRAIQERNSFALKKCAQAEVVYLELFGNFLDTLINYLCSILKPLGKE